MAKSYKVRDKLWRLIRPVRKPKWFNLSQVGEADLKKREVRVLHRKLLGGCRKDWALWWNDMPVPQRELYVLLHEFCHAFLPEHDEEAIEEMSRQLAVILWEEGFQSD